MGGRRSGLVGLLVFLSACAPAARRDHTAADLVLRGGAIYAGGASAAPSPALAIADGRVVFVGSDDGASAWIGPATRVIDLKGYTVLPGFEDSHVHPAMGGAQLAECSLNDLDRREKVYEAVARYAADHPKAACIRGGGWDLPLFPSANPRKEDLDRLVPDRPAFLVSADMHSAWVNSAALREAGITRDTPNPPRGVIERDPKTGEPSGALREPAAMDFVSDRLKSCPPPDYEEGLRRALRLANSLGITALHDAWGTKPVVEALRALDRRGELTARMSVALYADPARGAAQVPEMIKERRRLEGRRLSAHTVKVFLDGVIEARTAAMLEPYDDKPGDRGQTNWTPEALDEFVVAADRAGFQVHVHAIGDRAVRMALDAFEKARAADGPRDSRHEIAHLEVVEPEDVPRFARLGVVANFQPYWLYADDYITQLTLPALGPRRSRRLYSIADILKSGARLACGSDWPVSTMNPLEAIQVAVTRRDPSGGPGPAWLPEQRVGVADMVACYTTGGAYANFQDKETGSLTVGRAADLVVLDRDIFKIPAPEIHSAKALLTLVGGREVYRDPAFSPER